MSAPSGDKQETESGGSDHFSVILARLEKINNDINTLQQDLSSLKVDHHSSSGDIVAIKKDVNNLSTKLDRDIKKTEKQITEVRKENSYLHQKIADLQSYIADYSQFSVQNIIKIDNVPSSTNEDLISIIKVISEVIEFNFNEDMVDSIYRGRIYRNSVHSPVFVIFLKNSIKTKFLITAKSNRNKLNSSLFDPAVQKTLIYVNEYLSPFKYKIFKQAKLMIKEGKIYRVWTRNGRVMVRLSENSNPVSVRSIEDLLRLQGPSIPTTCSQLDILGTETDGDELETDSSQKTQSSTASKKRKIRASISGSPRGSRNTSGVKSGLEHFLSKKK